MKVLIVEDNSKLLESLEEELKNHFEVDSCSFGEEAIYNIKQNIYDLIILDLMLPDISGLDILKSIRKNGIDTLVLILTAKESLNDKVSAFEIGANDYLTKPFYMEELVARVYAMLRTNGKIKSNNKIVFKDLYLDTNNKTASINGEDLNLQNKQFN